MRIRLERTPGTREHVALLRHLWQIAEDEPSIGAVVLELRTAPASSMAHVQELRDAVYMLRRAGKKVLCHLEDADGSSLYLCSAADRILLNPAGGIRFAGMRVAIYYSGCSTSRHQGRLRAHRRAQERPEAFVRHDASEVAPPTRSLSCSRTKSKLTQGIAHGRKLTPEAVRASIAKGPFVAIEAKTAGFVDGYAFDDELEARASALLGHRVRLIDDNRGKFADRFNGANAGVALIYVDGDMVDGRSQTIPLVGMKLVGSYTVAESIKKARENPMIGAVVLRVETGGGSAMAADVIWREIERTTKIKPVVVIMGTRRPRRLLHRLAWHACVRQPADIPGSIASSTGRPMSPTLRKLGVNVEVYKTAPRADAESLFRPFSDEENVELKRRWSLRRVFCSASPRVESSRRSSGLRRPRAVCGRASSSAAQLVDELGGLRQALTAARSSPLDRAPPISELRQSRTTIIGRILASKASARTSRTICKPCLPV